MASTTSTNLRSFGRQLVAEVRSLAWLRRSPGPSGAAPTDTERPQNRLADIVAHLEYLGYEVEAPESDGWSYARHQARYHFYLRAFPWGTRLCCTVLVDASPGKSSDAWLAYVNTANEKSRLTQFSFSEHRPGVYAVNMRALASGPYDRHTFGIVMDLWHEDLDLIRKKPEFPSEEARGSGGAVSAVTVH